MKKVVGMALTAVLLLLGIELFSYTYLDPTLWGNLTKGLVALTGVWCVLVWPDFKAAWNLPSFRYVLAFTVLPLFSVLMSWYYHSQGIVVTLSSMLPHYMLMVYFVLVLTKVRPARLSDLLIILAMTRTVMTLVEQFTYPDNVPFASRMDGYDEVSGEFEEVESRGGFYRFLIGDAFYLELFAGFYAFTRLLRKFKWNYLLVFLMSALGIYMDQTRQVIVAFIACIAMAPFIGSGKKSVKYFFASIVVVALVASFAPLLFGDLIDQTTTGAGNDSFRMMSYAYYLTHLGGPLTMLFGNGYSAGSLTEYGREISGMEEQGLWRVDIGVAGALHMLGLVFVVVFAIYYIVVVRKNWKYIDPALQLQLLSMALTIPFIFPMFNTSFPGYDCFIAIIFYLVDYSICRNRKRDMIRAKRRAMSHSLEVHGK